MDPQHGSDDVGEDDYDDIPLQHQRPFGAGLHRKAVAFVPASDDGGQLNSTDAIRRRAAAAGTQQLDIADLYLRMVLPSSSSSSSRAEEENEGKRVCEICRLPLDPLAPRSGSESESKTASTPHEGSLAHQVCLPHSHPPSALDRSRMGLTYLSSYGWDPDARKGLGAAQQGIQFPVKARIKDDNLGLGIAVPKNLGLPNQKKKKKKKELLLLDAGKVRKQVQEEKRRAERLRQQLSGRQDLEKYLGPGA